MGWKVTVILAGLALGATAAMAQATDEPVTPERDFSGVWTTYAEPGGAPAGRPRAAPAKLIRKVDPILVACEARYWVAPD
jgi:hypothetical protein